jgi:hypothetical protein
MRTSNSNRALLIFGLLIASALSGCATITSGPGNVTVEAHDGKGSRVTGADCVLRNSKGEWHLVTPGGASVAGAADNLVVRCDEANHEPGQASVVSTAKSEMFGNIIIGGVVGAVIDHASGAGYEYPPLLRIKMGDTVVIAPPRNNGANPMPHARPELVPRRTDWAALEDVDSVPTSGRGRESYRRFLTTKYPRAFAIGDGGRIGWSDNKPDAVEDALRRCEGEGNFSCRLYVVDNYVVWSGPAANSVGANANLRAAVQLSRSQHADPSLLPPRTDWAALDGIESLPIASRRGREAYRAFLAQSMPRAFAIGPKGTWASASGRADAISSALATCQATGGLLSCRLYAVDDYVVWSDAYAAEILAATWMPQSANEPSAPAGGLADAAAVPFLKERGLRQYREFLDMRSPRAFAVSAGGSFGWSAMRDDAPERALQYCQKSSRQPCRLYVVNDDVVWPLAHPAN